MSGTRAHRRDLSVTYTRFSPLGIRGCVRVRVCVCVLLVTVVET